MKKPAKKSKAKPTKAVKAKAKMTSNSKTATGMGDPDAKKVVNPQRTLDLKKLAIQRIGGTMEFSGRKWVITLKDKHRVEFESRELAGLTIEKLIAACNP